MQDTREVRRRKEVLGRSRACRQCRGTAFWDGLDEEFRCLQCGRPVAAPPTERAAA